MEEEVDLPAITAENPAGAVMPAGTNTAGLASDFETFLKMLTTQMRYQDPFNPMEATDFAVQLATFSSVEQQIRTNHLLESLAAQAGIAELAGLIGLSARSPAPVQYSGDPVQVAIDVPEGAEHTDLVVRNALGRIIDMIPIAARTKTYVWSGLGGDGMPVPEGRYTFELASYAAGELISNRPAETYSTIVEARRDDTGPVIVLADGSEVGIDAVSALRDPQHG
jgi:flagellar basal-body rod modification protein FlgD